ncbi:MAG: histidine phosphatase family protein [Eggerthellaceae bacterium]|jgi:broad specificity phosphatase PhoE
MAKSWLYPDEAKTGVTTPADDERARAAEAAGAVVFYVVRHGETEFNERHLVQGWSDAPLTKAGRAIAQQVGAGLASVDFERAYASDLGRAQATCDLLLRSWATARAESADAKAQAAAGAPAGSDVAADAGVPDGAATAPADAAGAGSPTAMGADAAGAVPAIVPDARLREWCYGDLEGRPGELMREVYRRGFGADLTLAQLNDRLPEVAEVLAQSDATGRAERFDGIAQRLKSFFAEVGASQLARGGGNVLVVTHSFAIRTIVYLIDPARVNTPLRYANAAVTRVVYDGKTFSLIDIASTTWLDRAR